MQKLKEALADFIPYLELGHLGTKGVILEHATTYLAVILISGARKMARFVYLLSGVN